MPFKARTKALVIVIAVFSLLAFALACSSNAAPTSTPQAPAQPATPVPPTAMPQPTATTAPGQPTPVPPSPTPTRVLPTATPASTGGPVYGGTLRFTFAMDVDTLDPAYNSLPGTYMIFYALYDSPFRLDPSAQLQPDLAKSWSFSPDGLTITLNLRQGVKFQDGTAFDANAFKANYDRLVDPANATLRMAELTPYISAVNVVDQYTVQIVLKKPYRPLLPNMAGERIGWVVSQAAVQKYGGGLNGNFGRNPVGTGPFMFKSWVPGQSITLVKNPNYWDTGKPYLNEIDFVGGTDASVEVAMMQTGEADVMHESEVSPTDVQILQKSSKVRTVPVTGSGTAILQFNTSIKPYDNLALRQAVSYGIDRTKFVSVVLQGQGEPATTFVPAGWAHNPDLKVLDYNPAMAKQKLTEAGYPNGVTIDMGCESVGLYRDQCDFTQAMLKDVGINVNIHIIPNPSYFAMNSSGYWGNPGFGTSQWAYRIDPDTIITALWYSGGFKDLGTFKDPQLDALIVQAATEYDTAKAKPMYDQIQTMAAQAANVPILAWLTKYTPISTSVQGFEPYPTGFEHVEFTWLNR